MADYVTIPDPDPRDVLLADVAALLARAEPMIALPPRRLELQAMRERIWELKSGRAT